jgi:hypothetical protein
MRSAKEENEEPLLILQFLVPKEEFAGADSVDGLSDGVQ